MSGIKVEHITFSERAARSKYIANRFNGYLIGRLLDIGCDMAVLKGLLRDVDYIGIDIGGSPDIKIDLDSADRLPFDDLEFTTSVCSDVLEHLDDLHFIFSEIVRVTKRFIIISLPNNWCNARRPIERGKGSFSHYGLPCERPEDRHKWFFGLTEAVDFIRAQERSYDLKIVDMVVNEKPRPLIVRAVRRLKHPNLMRYLNRYSHTVWVVYEKSKHDL